MYSERVLKILKLYFQRQCRGGTTSWQGFGAKFKSWNFGFICHYYWLNHWNSHHYPITSENHYRFSHQKTNCLVLIDLESLFECLVWVEIWKHIIVMLIIILFKFNIMDLRKFSFSFIIKNNITNFFCACLKPDIILQLQFFSKYNLHKEIHKTSMLKIIIKNLLSSSWNKYTYFSTLIWFKNASHWQSIRTTYEETCHLTSISIHFQYVNIRLELPSTLEPSRRCNSFSLVFILFILPIASL